MRLLLAVLLALPLVAVAQDPNPKATGFITNIKPRGDAAVQLYLDVAIPDAGCQLVDRVLLRPEQEKWAALAFAKDALVTVVLTVGDCQPIYTNGGTAARVTNLNVGG